MMTWKPIIRLGATPYFYRTVARIEPWLLALFVLLFISALIGGLWLAPADYQQGDGFRIIYVHVPSAFLGMSIYTTMAICGFITLVWRVKIAAMWMRASAPIGACFTFLALFTGAVWGKPMWGTWWIWDARLTSTLILLFLYLGFLALQSAITQPQARDRACALLVLIGVVNVPIIHYSVVWWNTLHQGATLSLWKKPAIDVSMLYPLLLMIAAFFMFYFLVTCMRVRSEILQQDANKAWIKRVPSKES